MIKFNFNNKHLRVIANAFLIHLSLWDGEKDEWGMYPRMCQIMIVKGFPKKVYLNISVKSGHFLDFQLFNLIVTTWSH